MKCEMTDEQRDIAWRWYCALRAVESVARDCRAAGIPLDLVADWLMTNAHTGDVSRWRDV